jgi:glutathione synthase/RimK-type ligase-like ATP-grasp enzyme
VILLASTDLSLQPFGDLDQEPTEKALAALGLDVRTARWDDPDAGWEDADLVLIRATWDYPRRAAAFLAWLDRTAATTTVLNPPSVVRWNLDKTYLGALADAGVPVVPTTYLTDPDAVGPAVRAAGSPQVVLKPTVSAGSDLTGRFDRDDPGIAVLAGQVLAAGKTLMVQPYQESVTAAGETALIFVDGAFSHAVRKGPILDSGGRLLGGTYTETLEPVTATAEQLDVAARALAAYVEVGPGDPLLYARVDLVAGPGDAPLLLELELVEPSLFLDEDAGAADRFARAIARRL